MVEPLSVPDLIVVLEAMVDDSRPCVSVTLQQLFPEQKCSGRGWGRVKWSKLKWSKLWF